MSDLDDAQINALASGMVAISMGRTLTEHMMREMRETDGNNALTQHLRTVTDLFDNPSTVPDIVDIPELRPGQTLDSKPRREAALMAQLPRTLLRGHITHAFQGVTRRRQILAFIATLTRTSDEPAWLVVHDKSLQNWADSLHLDFKEHSIPTFVLEEEHTTLDVDLRDYKLILTTYETVIDQLNPSSKVIQSLDDISTGQATIFKESPVESVLWDIVFGRKPTLQPKWLFLDEADECANMAYHSACQLRRASDICVLMTKEPAKDERGIPVDHQLHLWDLLRSHSSVIWPGLPFDRLWINMLRALASSYHPELVKVSRQDRALLEANLADADVMPEIRSMKKLKKMVAWHANISTGTNWRSERVDLVLGVFRRHRHKRPRHRDACIIVSDNTFFLDILQVAFRERYQGKVAVWHYDIRNDIEDREGSLRAFANAPKGQHRVLLATPGKMSEGIDKQTTANVLIRCGPLWKAEWEEQTRDWIKRKPTTQTERHGFESLFKDIVGMDPCISHAITTNNGTGSNGPIDDVAGAKSPDSDRTVTQDSLNKDYNTKDSTHDDNASAGGDTGRGDKKKVKIRKPRFYYDIDMGDDCHPEVDKVHVRDRVKDIQHRRAVSNLLVAMRYRRTVGKDDGEDAALSDNDTGNGDGEASTHVRINAGSEQSNGREKSTYKPNIDSHTSTQSNGQETIDATKCEGPKGTITASGSNAKKNRRKRDNKKRKKTAQNNATIDNPNGNDAKEVATCVTREEEDEGEIMYPFEEVKQGALEMAQQLFSPAGNSGVPFDSPFFGMTPDEAAREAVRRVEIRWGKKIARH